VERDDARVDWTRPAAEVARTIRAYDPKPGAFTTLRGADVKLFGPRVLLDRPDTPAALGEVLSVGPDGIVVACGGGAVRVLEVQPAGKKRLSAADWARGRGISQGDRLGDWPKKD